MKLSLKPLFYIFGIFFKKSNKKKEEKHREKLLQDYKEGKILKWGEGKK